MFISFLFSFYSSSSYDYRWWFSVTFYSPRTGLHFLSSLFNADAFNVSVRLLVVKIGLGIWLYFGISGCYKFCWLYKFGYALPNTTTTAASPYGLLLALFGLTLYYVRNYAVYGLISSSWFFKIKFLMTLLSIFEYFLDLNKVKFSA